MRLIELVESEQQFKVDDECVITGPHRDNGDRCFVVSVKGNTITARLESTGDLEDFKASDLTRLQDYPVDDD